ncbi:MAG: DUF3592 domain-containing protein [Bacteroidales bacterium]
MTTNWVGWMMSAIVFLLLFVAGLILKNPIRLLITGKRAEGVVVGMDTTSRFSNSPGAGPLQSPMVEFITSTGKRVRVSGRTYTALPSTRVGETVTIAYSQSNPRDAQILSWKEFPFRPAGFVLGFTAFVLLVWISYILLSKNPANGDPFHLLPAVIARFRLNPFRFPVLFLLSAASSLFGINGARVYLAVSSRAERNHSALRSGSGVFQLFLSEKSNN